LVSYRFQFPPLMAVGRSAAAGNTQFAGFDMGLDFVLNTRMNFEHDPQQSLSDPQLLAQIRAGESRAERLLFDRYYTRMVGLVRARMNPRLEARVATSDVAVSAMKSVMMGVRVGEFELGEQESLWPLLVTVTLNKIRNQWRSQTAQRQDVRRNAPLDSYEWLLDDARQRNCETELKDLVDRLIAQFTQRRQEILRLVLDGHGVGDIATTIGVSERTVYDTRRQAAESLTRLLAAANS
jgi:RNA polymerase sigma-70 factor, ECF subfamily